MADKISIEARISIKNMSAIRFNGTQLEDRVSKNFGIVDISSERMFGIMK